MCGYRVAKLLEEAGLEIDEAAVYTVLRRMRSRGLVEDYETTSEGRRVKKYRLTRRGREELSHLLVEYRVIRRVIDKLLGVHD